MGELVKLAITEYRSEKKEKNKNIKKVNINENEEINLNEYKNIKNTVLVYELENEEILNKLLKINDNKNNVKIIKLVERLWII